MSALMRMSAWIVVGMIVAAKLGAMPAHAQTTTTTGVPNALQGFSKNQGQPIQIDALSLEVRDKDKVATFTGNVKVVQGDTTMRSKSLVVFYDQDKPDPNGKQPPVMKTAQPGPGGNSSVRRIEAKGNVIVTQADQTVTGETGIFDVKANTVTMTGGVVLTKDKNVLKGDSLVVDMTTGVSRVESKNGRGVSGLFSSTPKDGKDKDNGGGSLSPFSTANDKPAAGQAPKAAGKPMKLN